VETVHLNARTTTNGRLLLDVPTSLQNSEVEVTVIVSTIDESAKDSLGWPVGFWKKFAGSMPDFPDIADQEPELVDPIS